MVVISKTVLNKFIERRKDSRDAMLEWYRVVKNADWSKFADMKQTFSDADAAGNDRYVFNIMWNRYRIVCIIHFDVRTLYIAFIGTHKEYDKIEVSQVKYKK